MDGTLLDSQKDITISINYSQRFLDVFSEEEFYLPPIDIIKNEILRESRGNCNIIHHDSGF